MTKHTNLFMCLYDLMILLVPTGQKKKICKYKSAATFPATSSCVQDPSSSGTSVSLFL